MAKTLNDDTPGVGHNQLTQAQRDKKLNQAINAQIALKKRMATTAAEFRQERQESVVSVVKDELGMTLADFNILVRAKTLKNDDENAEAYDLFCATMREGFNALGMGDQLNFLDAIEKDEGEDKAPAKKGAAKKTAAKKGASKRGAAKGATAGEAFAEDEPRDPVH